MKQKQLSMVLALAVALLATVLAGTPPQKRNASAEELMGAALHQEEVKGNLESAIALYKKVVAEAGSNRALAAKALVGMGQCYEKLGNNEARKAYERVVREFADQKDLAAQARARLAAMVGAPASVRTRLLWDNAIDLWGRTSADGRYFSFVDWSSCDLGFRDLITGENRKLTNIGGCAKAQAEVEASAVSPDGKRIAFAFRRFKDFRGNAERYEEGRADLLVIGSDGKGEKVLMHGQGLDYVEPHSWSPNGRWIAAAVVYRSASAEQGEDALALVSAETGQVRRFKVQDNEWPYNAIVSPDGKWVAYSIAPRGASPKLLVRAVEGNQSTEENLQDNAYMMGWRPDGRGVLFSRERGGTHDLYLLPVAGGKAMGEATPIYSSSDVGRRPAGVTAEGALLYSTFNRRAETIVLPWKAESTAPGAPVVSLPATTSIGWLLGNGAAHFSNDGKRLFSVTPSNAIAIREMESGGGRTITPQLKSWGGARWAHDGASLLVGGTGVDGKTGVYRVDDATGKATLLAESRVETWGFTPSRDGKTIYYGTPKKTQARDLLTGTDKTLFEAPNGGNYDLRVSHDGQHLAIRAGVYLAVVDLRTGQSREIYRVPQFSSALIWAMDWSADDRQLFTIVRPGGLMDKMELWVFSPEGGEPKRQANPAEWRGLSISPDGKHVATTSLTQRGQLWALENFLPALSAASAQAATMTTRRVWAGSDVDLEGAPSPDGHHLTFVDWETGDLAVRDLLTGQNRRLTKKGSWSESQELALFSVVSPDGKQVAFNWFNKENFYDLRILPLDSSPESTKPRVIYRDEGTGYIQPFDWSPDGKQILSLLSRNDRTGQIAFVSTADGSVRAVKTGPAGTGLGKVSLSPDGRYIAYDLPAKEGLPERDIFLLAADGGREIPLVEHPANDLYPLWTPDGKRVVFASDRTGTMDLWAVQVNDGKPQGNPELIKRDIGRAYPMGFTRKGSLYYGLNTRIRDVYIAALDPATGKVISPPVAASHRYVGLNTAPDWSPDGEYLAYVSQRGPVPSGPGSRIIAIRSIKTGEERQIPNKLKNPNLRPRWSPDGRSFVVDGKDTQGRQGIYRVDAQTGETTPIVQTESGIATFPSWSPDGKAIFYHSFDRKLHQLLRRDLETGRESEVYRLASPAYVRGQAVSPDGRRWAFSRGDPATRSMVLMLVPASGGEPRELIRLKEPESIGFYSLAWTPDGRQVLFVKREDVPGAEARNSLWRVSVEGGAAQKIELGVPNPRGIRFHPDGRRIAFSAGENAAEIWVLENFLPKLSASR